MSGTCRLSARQRLARLMLVLALGLSACRSEPIHFHTLLPTFSGGETRDANIVIQALSVPPQVDRAQIVVRQGDSSLAVLETDWWGATLADEMKNALGDQLGPRDAGTLPPLLARVEVRRFDSAPGQYALLDASWRIGDGAADSRPALICAAVLRQDAGASIDALVSAQQRNIAQLAARIEASARNWRAGKGCP